MVSVDGVVCEVGQIGQIVDDDMQVCQVVFDEHDLLVGCALHCISDEVIEVVEEIVLCVCPCRWWSEVGCRESVCHDAH